MRYLRKLRNCGIQGKGILGTLLYFTHSSFFFSPYSSLLISPPSISGLSSLPTPLSTYLTYLGKLLAWYLRTYGPSPPNPLSPPKVPSLRSFYAAAKNRQQYVLVTRTRRAAKAKKRRMVKKQAKLQTKSDKTNESQKGPTGVPSQIAWSSIHPSIRPSVRTGQDRT